MNLKKLNEKIVEKIGKNPNRFLVNEQFFGSNFLKKRLTFTEQTIFSNKFLKSER